MTTATGPKKRVHQGRDGWGRDSYEIPALAVAGSSYTGEFSDSPCPKRLVEPELKAVRAMLRQNGIGTRLASTPSGNVFMAKIWVKVRRREDYEAARDLVVPWLADHDSDTQFVHDAVA